MRCELLLSLGEAAGAGDRRASQAAFAAAAAIARRLDLPRQLALAAAGYGGRHMHARAGGDARLVPLLEEALSGLDDEDELRPRLLARLAGALRDEPSRDRRAALSAEAVALARKAGDPSALAYALDGRHAAILGPDTAAECLSLGTEVLDLARGMGDLRMTVRGYLDRFIAEVTIGDMHRGMLDLDATMPLVEELRLPTEFWQVYAAQTMIALGGGRLQQAEELMSRWFPLGERAQPEMATSIYWLHRQMLAEFRGGFDEVESALSELAEAYPARPFLRSVLAFVDARLGRNERARRALQELTAGGIAALPFEAEWLYGMSLLADTCVVLGDGEAAGTLYAALEPWGALNAFNHPEGMRGSVFRYLAKLAALLGRPDDAARHFEAAIEMNERMGARPWLAYTQHDYAQLLAERDRPGDRERADELLAEARSTYRELGMREPA